MGFRFPQKVLFRHCDPAGIVFYPRYFEMTNDCVEAFFEVLGHPFEEILKSGGIPTAKVDTTFRAPSYQGDQLVLDLSVKRVGASSVGLEIIALCGDEVRFEAQLVLVHTGPDRASALWPSELKKKLNNEVEGAA